MPMWLVKEYFISHTLYEVKNETQTAYLVAGYESWALELTVGMSNHFSLTLNDLAYSIICVLQ